MPLQPEGGWAKHRETLRKKILATLETYAPGLADRVTSTVLITPDESAALYGTTADGTASLTRLLSPFESRIRTPIAGLYLCGADAEPFDVISGRAGRMAAAIAVEDRRRARA
jgi:phytoene dehydrogenase-like protein